MRSKTLESIGWSLGILAVIGAAEVRAGEIVVPVSEDTWVDGLTSTSPRGNDTRLGICPLANYWIYLKFDLTSVAGSIEDIELRMARFSGSRPEEIAVYLVTDDGWSEDTLTGPTRPEPTDPSPASAVAHGQTTASGYDRFTSAALLTLARQEAAADATLSLMLREDPAEMFDVRYYRSKEAAVPETSKPRLVVTCLTAEVGGLHPEGASPTTVAWDTAGSGASYDVISGSLAELRLDAAIVAAVCLAADQTGESVVDPRADPAPGEGYYYLVRAEGPCGTGSFGTGPEGTARSTAACS